MKNKKYITFLIITLLFSFLGFSCVYAVTSSGNKKNITITGTNQPSNDVSFCGDSKNGKGRAAYLPTYKYNAKDPNFSNISQSSYCLQRGRSGPDGSTWSYVALDNFDISTCSSSSDNYQCGLAEIMCHTMNIGVDSNGNFTANENSDYSYASVSTALRMWVAYDHASIHDGDGIKDNTNQGEYYYSNTDVYEKSAKYYLDKGGTIKQCPSSCAEGTDEYGVFCYQNASSNELKNIQGALDLVNAAKSGMSCINNLNNTLNGNIDGENPGLDGELSYGKPGVKIDFEPEQKIADVTVRFDKMKIGSELISSTTENITIPVDWCDSASAGCNVVVEAFDSHGNPLDLITNPSACSGKNYCEIKYKYEQLCEQTKNDYQDQYITVKVTVYVDKSSSGNGAVNALIKNYVRANGDVSQQFINFDIEGLNKLKNGKLGQGSSSGGSHTEEETQLTKGPVYTVKGTPVCPCDKDNRCDDFKIKNDLPDKCTNYGEFNSGIYDTYDEGKLEEPYMNCIMNACNVTQRNQYDFSKEYKVDVGICRIFCREEVEFYMANKTRVYAGMQFKYEINRLLDSSGKRKLLNGNSLTSMVLQKRQCASEIYYDHRNPWYNYNTNESKYNDYIKAGYDTWQKMYKQALEDLMKKWNEWKEWEALHKQARWDCLIEAEGTDGILSKGGQCAAGSGGACPSCSISGEVLEDVRYLYKWPIKDGEPKGEIYKYYGLNNVKIITKTGENEVTTTLKRPVKKSGSNFSGQANQFTTCSSVCCETSTRINKDGVEESYCSKSGSKVTGSCVQGKPGNHCDVQTKLNNASTAFKNALDRITQLVYDLQNCNLYSNGEIDIKYATYNYTGYDNVTYNGKYIKATSEGTTKEHILKLANCKAGESCISLDLSYDDKKYGEETTFGKEVEIVTQNYGIKGQEDQTYYCVNDDDTKEKASGDSYSATCYPGPGKTDKDLTSSSTKKKHTWIGCQGWQQNVKCESEDLKWPINDFAIFTVVSEADFWQPKTYSTEAYTGNVYESGSSYGASTTSLPPYVFPVSMDKESGGATGAYDVHHKYSYVGSALSKAQLLNENYYEFTCQYEVYNITNLYDCDISDSLEKCKNECYEIRNGVPIIREDDGRCATWNDRKEDSKGYGFIYRNVDLAKLFPSPRPIGTNWLAHDDVKEAVEATATDMYTDADKYLEYSYVLNSDAIKKIRTYNKDRNGAGGYIDNTLRSCDTSSAGFYNCTSTFLDLFRDDSNSFGIKVIKSDGHKGT